MKVRLFQTIGLVGTAGSILAYALSPSFPTPDKLFVFLFFVFLAVRHAKSFVKRLLPFVGIIITYEMFRGLVPSINHRVNYTWMPHTDEKLFGSLPTAWLQHWLWHGHVRWFDMVIYLVYMLHFVLPIALLMLIWRYREKFYWQVASSYVVLCFSAFVTFLIFPAAPPWMAAQQGLIQPITRISSQVWSALGIHDFPSVYNRIAPNPVAAVPSLHAAFATLFSLFVFKIFGKKLGLLSLVYPFIIYFGTVYQGEHYAIDELLGGVYAVACFVAVSYSFANYRSWKLSVRRMAQFEWAYLVGNWAALPPVHALSPVTR